MSKADVLFVNMCQEILDNGFSSEGQKVRPKWEDGTPAHTIKTFGVVNRYNLQEEFPALTLRPTAIKSAATSTAPGSTSSFSALNTAESAAGENNG